MKKIAQLLLLISIMLGLLPVPALVLAEKSGVSERPQSRLNIFSINTAFADSDDDDDDDDDDDRNRGRGSLSDRQERRIQKNMEKLLREEQKFLRKLFKKFGIKLDSLNLPPIASTTPDTIPPTISQINVEKTTTTATIQWKTNEPTREEVRYGTTTPITASSTSVVNNTLSLSHSVQLTNLVPGTLYSYVIVAKDAAGNVRENPTLTFQTNAPAPSDTTPPSIVFATHISLKATSTTVIWVTNESSDSKIWISTTTSVDTGAPTASSGAMSFFHTLDVAGLSSSTTYFYTLKSTDSAGNTGTLTGNSFTTPAN